MTTSKKPKQILTSRKLKFTEVQVRIHNTQYNFKAILNIASVDLYPYIDKIRREAKNWQGEPNYREFEHLPLVAFVDPDEKEEVVFADREKLPKEPAEIRTKKGTLIAKIT